MPDTEPTEQPGSAKPSSDAAESPAAAPNASNGESRMLSQRAKHAATRIGSRLPGFLKPDRPTEALALLSIGAIIGGAAVTGFRAVTAGAPWTVQADQVCLSAGNAYLSVAGDGEGTPPSSSPTRSTTFGYSPSSTNRCQTRRAV